MVVTLIFDEAGGKTTLTMRTVFGSVAMRNEHMGMGFEQGTGSALDQLADLVAQMGAKGVE